MVCSKKSVCIIPARLASTRFPEKILANLNGEPLIKKTWESASKVSLFSDVIIALDSEKTAEVVEKFSGKYFFTSTQCKSGTERILELYNSKKIAGNIFINWQADEPFINEKAIEDLLKTCAQDSSDVWTLKQKTFDKTEMKSRDVVKVVCDKNGNALYFSRSQIPHGSPFCYKHIGLYAYSINALEKINWMEKSQLEDFEKLEQLRFLEYGLKIKVHETNLKSFSIDTIEDLKLAEKFKVRKLCPIKKLVHWK